MGQMEHLYSQLQAYLIHESLNMRIKFYKNLE